MNSFSFLFFIEKGQASALKNRPIEVALLEEQEFDGEKMYLPKSLTDFMVENLRQDYGSDIVKKMFQRKQTILLNAFPNENLLKNLNSDNYEGYRVSFLMEEGKYALVFKCG